MRLQQRITANKLLPALVAFVVVLLVTVGWSLRAGAQWQEPTCAPPKVKMPDGSCQAGQEQIFAPLYTGVSIAQSREGSLRLGYTDPATSYILDVLGPADISGNLTVSTSTLNPATPSGLTVDSNTFVVDTANRQLVIGDFTSPQALLSVGGGTLEGLRATSSGSEALFVQNSGTAVLGTTSAVGQAGVYALGPSLNALYGQSAGIGVKGQVTGSVAGVYRGVVGKSTSTSGVGVFGETSSTDAGNRAGVWGKGSSIGVRGVSAVGAGSTYSIRAAAPTAGDSRYSVFVGSPSPVGATEAYAGYFDGTLKVKNEIVARRFLASELQSSIMPFTSGQSLPVDTGLPSSLPSSPVEGLAFDGGNVWIGYRSDGTIRKVRASDGLKVGEVATVTAKPVSLAYDGTYIWVLSDETGTDKIYPIDTQTATFSTIALPAPPLVSSPTDIVVGSDVPGGNIYLWVSDSTGRLLKLQQDGTVLMNQAGLPVGATAVAFDGTYVWLANGTSNSATRCLASATTCTVAAGTRLDVAVGQNAVDVTSDGAYVWVTNKTDGTVTKVRTTDGAAVGAYATRKVCSNDATRFCTSDAQCVSPGTCGAEAGSRPSALAQDGTYLWVANLNAATATLAKLRLADGSLIEEYALASWTDAGAMLFDGTSVWAGVEAAAPPTLIRRFAGTGFALASFPGSVTVAQGFSPSAQTGNVNISGTAIVSTLSVAGNVAVGANLWGKVCSNDATRVCTSDSQCVSPGTCVAADVTKPVSAGSSANCDEGEFLKGIQTTDGALTAIICRKL